MEGIRPYLVAIVLGIVGVAAVVGATATGLGSEGLLVVGSAFLGVAATRTVDTTIERRRAAEVARDARWRELDEARRAAYMLRVTLDAATPDKVGPLIGAVATLTNSLARSMPLDEAAALGADLFNGMLAGSGKDRLDVLITELTAQMEALRSASDDVHLAADE